ncbi:MAG: Flp pilus assembly complex ATPase component TadA [Candidatus Omnitrophica bacterium]|nr:Flp pilus assembly complex ATPase component TadA [Candidatus Omnitrophota bacterium]MBU1997278.1 Flp pilus assembly complex ATPase component TadA [Candidatus Omnitrophota bacterium]MBU4333960.1 Flp pilus assembly complex ATPase component TadA [Candidatus Omnitrophota bacterium]
MDRNKFIDLEFKLLEKLSGHMNLMQAQADREQIVGLAIQDLVSKGEFSYLKPFFENEENKVGFIEGFLTYGIITEILCDYDAEDIIINNLRPIYIHHARKGFISTGKKFSSQREVDLFIGKLLLFAGKTKLKKIMDIELHNLEGRVNIALSSFGPQVTITKAKVNPLSIIDLIRKGSMSYEVAAQLWIYLEGLTIRPANIIIAGGPGVGKTTLMNALFSFIPESDRMVIIEDTLELNTFLEDSCSRLESDADTTLADLVRNSLRMRPERIIIGEVRGEEAKDMITACNVGKYCMGTIHALTSREAIIRLQNEPMNIPDMLVNLIDVFIVLKRYHTHDKIFRVVEEISETSGMEQLKILLSQVYKFDKETMTQKQVNPSTIFRDRLASQSGLTPKDVMQEHMIRAFVLRVMDEKDINTIKEVSTLCRAYNRKPVETIEALGYDRSELLGEKKTKI